MMDQLNIPFRRQIISKEDEIAIQEALKKGFLTRGPLVSEFEHAFANYCGTQFAVSFSSGTAASMAAAFATDLASSDWVITSPNCPFYTVISPLKQGSRVYLTDVDSEKGHLNLNDLENKLKLRATRGRPFIIPSHRGLDLDDISGIDQMINHPDAIILEEGSEVFGSSYPDGKKVGSCSFSLITTFCLHPDRLITTGEGGMAVTNDESIYNKLLLYRNNGQTKEGEEIKALTGNFHLTEIQAALGLSQLNRIDQLIAKRKSLAQRYHNQLKKISSLSLPAEDLIQSSYGVKISTPAQRQRIIDQLKENRIETAIPSLPLHAQPLLNSIRREFDEEFPCCDAFETQLLYLPYYDSLKEEEIDRVCETLKKAMA